MSEIQLICPKCAASYRISSEAIPARGRRVECSACLHVWHVMREQMTSQPDGPTPPAGPTEVLPPPQSHAKVTPGAVPLHRPLPENVLRVLQDEVAFEMRARQGLTDQTVADSRVPADAQPATRQDIIDVIPVEPHPITESREHTAQQTAAPTSRAPGARSRAGYVSGFLLPVAVAVAILIVAALPRLDAPEGTAQIAFAQVQDLVETGRVWFTGQVASIRGTLP